ncbi:hypothetical protein BKP45_11020 [Anaerobacillus alkalidiazotrophicus]|uniref:4Fe-4S ferredoxin-type domain-containing protein n=1 Tax=Anaerobacillus alkalidiazotrophicus TaxID=472963 RepID=A0A1S2M0S7_9BACI|nr:4Fe-4S dicluster domain-containing protein [Anaerobacillus alkalidiazotrophicus]OIJ18120.1 hypothetical protein BKP45_16735 [Anaerobacillus alkalidiazotrophicus]OIJ19599.1 hypothetical protein BKP45_11020 [Anaerobacillus alkalidiazotrophicus]
MWSKFLLKRMVDKSFVRLSESRCLRNRNKHSQCSLCEEVCPQPAINITDGKLTLDSSKCSNCRLCIHVCPTEAFNYEFEQLHKYEQKIQSCESVCFSCEEQGDPSTDVILPCVSSLRPEMLMIGTLYEKEIQILWNEKRCLSCKSNWTHKRDLIWINEWNGSNISECNVEIIDNKDARIASKRKVSRRELFSLSKNKTKDQVAHLVFDSFDQSSNLRDKLSLTDRRKYLLSCLKGKNSIGNIPDKIAKKLGIVKLEVTNNCQLCRKCSATCPTGALKLEETEEKTSLIFQAHYCIDCDICENVCLEIRKSSINFEEIRKSTLLHETKLNECPGCGDKKIETKTYCEECNVKQVRKSILYQNGEFD